MAASCRCTSASLRMRCTARRAAGCVQACRCKRSPRVHYITMLPACRRTPMHRVEPADSLTPQEEYMDEASLGARLQDIARRYTSQAGSSGGGVHGQAQGPAALNGLVQPGSMQPDMTKPMQQQQQQQLQQQQQQQQQIQQHQQIQQQQMHHHDIGGGGGGGGYGPQGAGARGMAPPSLGVTALGHSGPSPPSYAFGTGHPDAGMLFGDSQLHGVQHSSGQATPSVARGDGTGAGHGHVGSLGGPGSMAASQQQHHHQKQPSVWGGRAGPGGLMNNGGVAFNKNALRDSYVAQQQQLQQQQQAYERVRELGKITLVVCSHGKPAAALVPNAPQRMNTRACMLARFRRRALLVRDR
eukprot:111869-Chlamydomonas_euryale.AAC.2